MRQETLGESLLEIAALLLSAAASWASSAWIILRDQKKLSGLWLERSYAPATLACSVFAFQQIAVFVHFVRTRRSLGGVLLGLFWAAVAFVPALLVNAILPN